MSDLDRNKQRIREFIATVWEQGDLDALPHFWADDCINHAMPTSAGGDNRGLAQLRVYHQQFFLAFAAFGNVRTEIVQQIAEGDRVVTHVVSHGEHTGEFFGIAPTGRQVTLAAIRIDRIAGDRIAEHWSVSDMAGLMQQLQG